MDGGMEGGAGGGAGGSAGGSAGGGVDGELKVAKESSRVVDRAKCARRDGAGGRTDLTPTPPKADTSGGGTAAHKSQAHAQGSTPRQSIGRALARVKPVRDGRHSYDRLRQRGSGMASEEEDCNAVDLDEAILSRFNALGR
jgi:hypothetical protein